MEKGEAINLNLIKTGNIENKDRLKKLLFYLVTNRPRSTKTELVKLSFLIDYSYAQLMKQNKSYSTVTYVKYNYGPYADAFTEVLGELENEGKIKNDFDSPEVHKFIYISISNELEGEVKEILENKLILGIIKKVLSANEGKTLNEIKEVVYSLQEVKNTPFLKEIILFEEGTTNDTKITSMELRS